MTYKPGKYCNEECYEIDLDGNFIELIKLNFDPYYLASIKKDGYFSCFIDGQMKTSRLKLFENKQIREKFEPITQYAQQNNIIITGEVYSHEIPFNDIGALCRTEDFENKRSIKKHGKILKLPESLKINIFDATILGEQMPFSERYERYIEIAKQFPDIAAYCEQTVVKNMAEVKALYLWALEKGYEGLVLKHPDKFYKYGRTTVKENSIFKIKPFRHFKGIIVGYDQAEEVNADAEKKINELGRSVTSKKKGDRHLIDSLANFVVIHDGYEQRVCCSTMTKEERAEAWTNRESYIGKEVRYKGLEVGKKERLRHVTWVRP